MARLTTQQKQSRKLSRSKKQKKRLQTIKTRLTMICVLLPVLTVAGGGWWLHQSGWVERQVEAAQLSMYQATANAGFRLNNLYVKGRERTQKQALVEALNVDMGSALLAVPLDEVKARLEQMSTVREAHVERMLPDTLHIELQEREPVAIWQESPQSLHVIDEEGVVLQAEQATEYPELLVVVGQGAPTHLSELLALLESSPTLSPRVIAAIRVGERRWNVQFEENVSVMLPEDAWQQAWKKLAEMQREQGILQKSIETIDMRLGERIFIKLAPTETPKQKKNYKNARET